MQANNTLTNNVSKVRVEQAPKIEQTEISSTVISVKQVQNQWGFSIFPVSHHFGNML